MPNVRKLTVVAQDPGLRGPNGAILTAQVEVPYEDLTAGPRGYRVQIVDYDATTGTLYRPLPAKYYQNGRDPFAGAGDKTILGDPRFHAQNVYAIVMRTLAKFEQVLGRRASWSFHGHQLHAAPHAFAGANAFYSKEDRALLFGYFPSPNGKQTVFSCLSHDVIVHETTHALLDGLRERYTDPSSPDQAAFHEGFADVIALLSAFSIPEVVATALSGGDRNPKAIPRRALSVASLRHSVLLGLAEQMGDELSGVRGNALRRSITLPPSPEYLSKSEFEQPHRRGELFAAAVMNAFLQVWHQRMETLGDRDGAGRPSGGPLDRGRVIEEGAGIAGRLMKILIRALDYAPAIDLHFSDFLSAALTADYELVPNDAVYGFRQALRDAFAAFGIAPSSRRKEPEVGLWEPPEQEAMLDYGKVHFDSMQQDPDEVFRFIWENRKQLKLEEDAYTEVLSVRPCRRVAPDGFVLKEIVAEYRQILNPKARELARLGIRRPNGMPADLTVPLYGGGALIFDEYGRLKYHVRNRIGQAQRQSARLAYLWRCGHFDAGAAARRRFWQLHINRMSAWPLGLPAPEEF